MATRDLSVANLDRQQKLFASGFVSEAVIDDARMQVKRDEAAVAQLQASVATAKLPARTDEIRAAEADARAAREALAQADWRLGQRAIASPVDRARQRHLLSSPAIGSPPAAPVASLLPPANVKVRFFVPEPSLGADQAGPDASTFTCDGCGAPMRRHDHLHLRPRGIHAARALLPRQPREARLPGRGQARAPTIAARLNPGQPVDVVAAAMSASR